MIDLNKKITEYSQTSNECKRKQILDQIIEQLKIIEDSKTTEDIVLFLSNTKSEYVAKNIQQYLYSNNTRLKNDVIDILTELIPVSLSIIKDLSHNKDKDIRIYSYTILNRYYLSDVVPKITNQTIFQILLHGLEDTNINIKQIAIETMGLTGVMKIFNKSLVEFYHNTENITLKLSIITTLGRLEDKETLDFIIELYHREKHAIIVDTILDTLSTSKLCQKQILQILLNEMVRSNYSGNRVKGFIDYFSRCREECSLATDINDLNWHKITYYYKVDSAKYNVTNLILVLKNNGTILNNDNKKHIMRVIVLAFDMSSPEFTENILPEFTEYISNIEKGELELLDTTITDILNDNNIPQWQKDNIVSIPLFNGEI